MEDPRQLTFARQHGALIDRIVAQALREFPNDPEAVDRVVIAEVLRTFKVWGHGQELQVRALRAIVRGAKWEDFN